MEREDIQIIAKYSNWSKKGVAQSLNNRVYNTAAAWQKFLQLLFLGLGVSFMAAGVIFFFAYNWADLHKFIKLSLIGSLLFSCSLLAIFSKLNTLLKKALLTSAAILVGVLLAVFGQVYQTGANAYDLFLNWTLFVALWAIIANFAPLWTLLITLLNITVILYSEQIAHHWSEVFFYTILFAMNAVILTMFIVGSKVFEVLKAPKWFTGLLVLATLTYSTIGLCLGVFTELENPFLVLLSVAFLLYGAGLWYGLKTKSTLYLSVIPFSVIMVVSAFLLRLSESAGMLLIISLFIIASVTILIMALLNLHRKWNKQTV